MKNITTMLLLGVVCGFTPGVSALTSTDANNILFLKQEEKLAHDVYQFLYVKWGHATFGNISLSEQRHMDAVDGLIARYRLEDESPEEQGQFTFPELQELYEQLIAQGSQSLAEALAVGVIIEEMDITDIQKMLAATTESPIRRVLTNLLNGSYNHLDAFNKALDQLAPSSQTAISTANDATTISCQPVASNPGKMKQQRGQR
jgi:hypothetical protein